MPKAYEHTFADLHSGPEEPSPTVVELGPEGTTDQTGARVKLNDAPGNPDKGKADQFGDITPAAKANADTDDGIDVELEDGAAEHAEGADATGDDDDLRGYSQNVRDRINRERRQREEAEERSRRIEAEFAQLNRKVDLQAKESEWQSADEKADQQLADLRAKKVKALEEGKTEEVVDLDDKITDVKADKRARDAERTRLRDEAKKAPAQPAGPTNPKARAWIDKHPQYNTDPLFKKATLAADQTLYALGLNANSDEYYVELSKLLSRNRNFNIDQSYLKGGRQRRGGPGGTGSNGVRAGNTGQVRTNAGGRMTVTVTAEDKAMLAQMGQDVQDPQVIKAFAREKLALARAEAAQRGER